MYFHQVTIIRILHAIFYNGNYVDVSVFKKITAHKIERTAHRHIIRISYIIKHKYRSSIKRKRRKMKRKREINNQCFICPWIMFLLVEYNVKDGDTILRNFY